MHDPVGFFRLSLPAVVCVEDEDFLEAFDYAADEYGSGFAGFVPTGFVAFLVGVDFTAFSCPGRVGL